ncbi:hypothetical protein DFH08DRAFT_714617 [Mycena albidolilacea]|uniref:DUF6589 domain-containing protein n=1 Tax=Mycena albidolilacea TaxID=1033008 RepID=A0AAD7EG84_9AGAR|nr:hypothetical protein DFH08DRAFT_714617 [Mycena albidolilacea]
MRPHVEDFACEIIAEEMEIRRRNSILPGIAVFTPDFIEKWTLDEDKDHSPFLTSILTTASPERAKKYNKLKNPDKLVQVVTHQLLYQSSNRCMSFQAQFGLFLWSTGSARQTINAAFRCGLSVSYDSVLNLGQSLGLGCTMENTLFVATEPHGLGYDNLNISTSIFVEQRGASGPAKVTSGTFGVLYGLRNANFDDMLIAPIMRCLSASTGLHFNRDIRPSSEHLGIFHDQLIITVIETLLIYNKGFDDVAKHPSLQHQPIRAIPVGYRTPQFATQASTIEEATVRGNLQYHDELYVTQLKRTPEEMSKRDVFQLGFGLFHLCLNLVWAILHTHRGSINELGSLAYFFALMEKKRLINDQPDYHSLLAALTEILHGLLLNAWSRECGFSSFKLFADSKPNPTTLRDIASRIVNNYATPMAEFDFSESPKDPAADAESLDSETDGEGESPFPSHSSPAPAENANDDVAYHNTRLLTRDLLMVVVLVRAISDGDIGRVEALLPHLAMMFRGAGCNKYCSEILRFIHNLKHVWTPKFAYGDGSVFWCCADFLWQRYHARQCDDLYFGRRPWALHGRRHEYRASNWIFEGSG